jgi:hypothetical protein
MENLAEVLEHELEQAVQVKDRGSLHRYITLLSENIVSKNTYEIHLLEVKNEIKLLTETMKQGFELVDKRFEAVDKRFEDIYNHMDKRFEAVNKRFEAVDKRFEDIYNHMDKRFEAVDKRFEDMNKRFTMMFTFMNIGFGIIILLTILFKFLQ